MTVTIHLEGWPSHIPLMSEPICLICKDPRTCDRVLTLTSGAVYRISFLCKDLSRLRITAEKGIGMTKVSECCSLGNVSACFSPGVSQTCSLALALNGLRLETSCWPAGRWVQ